MTDNPGVSPFWKWLAAVLIILNLVLLTAVWYRPGGTGRGNNEKPFDYVCRELKLDERQIAAYAILRNHHHDSMTMLEDEGRIYSRAYFALLKDGGKGPNTTADSLLHLIGQNQQQIVKTTFLHFSQVRMLCNDRQKVIFDAIIGQTLRMMGGPQHGRDEVPGGKPPEQ